MHPGSRRFRLLEVVTVGFPFCAFKVLTGIALRDAGRAGALGGVLVTIGAVDLLLNAIALGFAVAGRDHRMPVCTAQWVVTWFGRGRGWWQLGLSVDAMFAFTLVAGMIGLGGLAHLSRSSLGAWNVCVVFNVLGAGLGRLAESVFELVPDAKTSA